MRLSDARLRRRQRKILYLNHRLPPWLNEDATPRSLEPMVRIQPFAKYRALWRTDSAPYAQHEASPTYRARSASLMRRDHAAAPGADDLSALCREMSRE